MRFFSCALGFGFLALAGSTAACGSDGSSGSTNGTASNGSASTGSTGGAQPSSGTTSPGTGGSASNGTASNGGGGAGGAGTSAGGSEANSTASASSANVGGGCVGDEAVAEPVPLDLYIMLDKSGSMLEPLAAPSPGIKTKWDAVKSALTAFFQDPQSNGMGAGIQYFPIPSPDAPTSCTSNDECQPDFGYCRLRACLNAKGNYCSVDADCPKTPQGNPDTCLDIGTCSNKPTAECQVGFACPGGGTCIKKTESICVSSDSCSADDYAVPAVEIGKLNGAAPALVTSMNSTSPAGQTPTEGALSGAIEHASAWAVAHPTHRVVAVLVTDGEPKSFACSVQDADGLKAIAAAGVAASPSIPTFAIGVLGQLQGDGKNVLAKIAEGGGTNQAFIIDPATDVKQQFIDALVTIRGTQLACDFQVPPAPAGQTLAYDQVNVQHTPKNSSAAETLTYVTNEAGCDPVNGGWYYDQDPAQGGTPTTIVVCPSTCAELQDGGSVKFSLGCETIHE